jgi:hypothetical protein
MILRGAQQGSFSRRVLAAMVLLAVFVSCVQAAVLPEQGRECLAVARHALRENLSIRRRHL